MTTSIRSVSLWGFRGLNLEFVPARVVGLFGKNGVGKTNTLEAIDQVLTHAPLQRIDPLRDRERWIRASIIVDVGDAFFEAFLHGPRAGPDVL